MDYEEFAEKYFDYNTNEFDAPENTKVVVSFELLLQMVSVQRLDFLLNHSDILVEKE